MYGGGEVTRVRCNNLCVLEFLLSPAYLDFPGILAKYTTLYTPRQPKKLGLEW